MSQTRQRWSEGAPNVPIELLSPVVGIAQDHESGDRIPRHRHDVAQLIHAASGVLTVETDDGTWVIPPARAVWVPAGVTHSIAMTGRSEMRTLYLARDREPIGGPECCVVQVSPLLHEAVLRAIDFEQPYPVGGAEERIVEVVLDEISTAEVAPLHLPLPADPRARKVAEEFLRNPAERQPARAWARAAGAGERTLERLFVRDVGTTFGQWQQQARLLEALRLLAAGDDVTTVALRVGYETPSAFIAMFRRSMGVTPGRYFGP